MLHLWCLQNGKTALVSAIEGSGDVDVVNYLVEHKADIHAKSKVIIALADGKFDCLNFLTVSDAVVVSSGWLHRAYVGLIEWSP